MTTRVLGEKRRYWERRLWDLLGPLPVTDLLIMSWAIEAIRSGRTSSALRYAAIPGNPEEHKITGKYFIPPWSIDGVLNERLVMGAATCESNRRLDLKTWGGIAKLMNVYGGLANIEGVSDYDSNQIIAAIPRLFWPQYDWQLGFENIFRIARAWHVYATPEGSRAFAQKHTLDLEKFLKVAFAIYVSTESHPAVLTSYVASIGAARSEVLRVGKIIGGTLEKQAAFAKEIRNASVPRDFRRSVIKERPLFEVRDRQGPAFLVPSRAQFMLRVTDGLYYDIVQDGDARRSSGDRFEDLCRRLLEHYCSPSFEIEGERDTSYGKSADLFLLGNDSDLGFIVECKIRRLPQKVLTSPDPWRDCEKDFGDIIKGIVQIWRTNSELDSMLRKHMVGIVLQYDPWAVMGNAFVSELFERAHQMADNLSVPKNKRIPVALVGYADFERSLRSYDLSDVHDAVSKSVEEKFHGYELSGILSTVAEKGERKPNFDYSSLVKAAAPWWGEK